MGASGSAAGPNSMDAPAAFRPVVRGIDAVGKVDAGEAQRRLVGIGGLRERRGVLRQQGQRFQPRQSERDAGAAQEVTA